jgi:hypothetical protein
VKAAPAPAAAKSGAASVTKTTSRTATKAAAKTPAKTAAKTPAKTPAKPATKASKASTKPATTTSSSTSYGNPSGHAPVPAAGRPVNTSHPTRVIGNGTAKSCTSAAVVRAVARGGIIVFNCGRKHVTIHMTKTAKIYNTHKVNVLDGRGRVTLDGGGKTRIFYQNACDPELVWTSSRCDLQKTPKTTLQNLTFRNGTSIGQKGEFGGGGAIYVRGGQVNVINSGFYDNRRDTNGAALRVIGTQAPVYVVHSTFVRGKCDNGGGIGGLGTSVTVLNSLFRGNAGTSTGGAIAVDGNYMELRLNGTKITGSQAPGGSAIAYTSNDHTGILQISHSYLVNGRDRYDTKPGVFFIGRSDGLQIDHSTLKVR